jgi:alpha-mannosidase
MKNTDKKIYTIATAHLDTCWLWTYEKTISAFVPGTLKENFALFEKFPDYKFNFEGSNRYELMQEYYPEDFEKLRKYAKEGRWHPCGSCYENGDVNTPSPEALTRNILYGNGFFRKEFGVESNDIFLPDCFGFGRALPSIAAHSGLTGFSTQKLTWGGSVDVPFDIGRWTGKDGKGIWCALKPGNYITVAGNLRKTKSALKNLKENTEKYANPRTFVYNGTGDRGGAAAKKSVKNIAKAAALNSKNNIKVLFSTTKEFFDEMESLSPEEKSLMPVFDGELLLTEHGTDSYTSRTVTKRWNRRCELLADAAERFSVAAYTQGLAEYPAYVFEKAWKKVILHQFHDDITGTSFEECYKRSHNDYVQAMHSFSSEYTTAIKSLSREIDTSFVKGTAVIVSNAVQNTDKRTQCVSADIDFDGSEAYVRVYDSQGKEVASQMKKLNEEKVRVSFMASVVSCGVAVYDVCFSDEKSSVETSLSYKDNVVENDNIKVTIDEKGDIASVYNKKRQIEALSESIKLAVLHDVDSYAWPSWEVKQSDLSRKPYMYPSAPVITIEENGAAVCKIKIVRKAGKSAFTQILSLDAESDYISVENEVDWREEASMLKAEFRTKAENEKALYDIGFGYTERQTNTPRLFEVPAQKWAGITDKNQPFGTAIFSDSRTGWDKPDASTIRLTCIHTPLNNYRWECSQHIMDLGINRFGFAVYPHSGETDKIMAKADEFCQPMHTFIADKHTGRLASEYSAVKVNCDSVRITAMKKAEESDKVIVRVCEYTGKAHKNVEIEFPCEIAEAFEVRGDEKEIGRVQHNGRKLVIDMNENAVRSFALVFEDKAKKHVKQKAVDLPYNVVAVTSNSNRSESSLKSGFSIPKELVPESVLTSGVCFAMPSGILSGLVCKGQVLNLEKGYGNINFLITSLSGDRDATFDVGNDRVTFKIQNCFEPIGMWDLMMNRITAYIKKEPQMLTFTHTHTPKGDAIAKQMYFFKAEVPLNGSNSIRLPDDENILILSATLSDDKNSLINADEHFDTIKKRDFDYSFSDYALKASKPAKFELILDKFIDRTVSPSIITRSMYSKLSPGELYYYLRNIPALVRYPSLKKKMLSRK